MGRLRSAVSAMYGNSPIKAGVLAPASRCGVQLPYSALAGAESNKGPSMTVTEEARSMTMTTVGCRSIAMVQWNEPLDAVLARMNVLAGDAALVLQGDRPIGRITRLDMERLQQGGNWFGCIAAVDAMSRQAGRSGPS